ncbi:MAG: hypothetical protein JWM80_269, partial [Cyanobacteria bacterium RYN_339]|nr:hypothetical protein [Cyanobacteria bacterium RYN_339]
CTHTPGAVAPQTLAAAAPAALAASATGITAAMFNDFAKLLDANGDGQITKNEGFVELMGTEPNNRTLICNFYDEKYQNGDQVKPVPTATFIEKVGQGYSFNLRAIKGDKRDNGYDTIAMNAKEVSRLANGVADIMDKSPLKKNALIGGGIPVRHVVTPHYLFRKATDKVERWSIGAVGSNLAKRLADKTQNFTVVPNGKHADGAFVLEVHDFPAI